MDIISRYSCSGSCWTSRVPQCCLYEKKPACSTHTFKHTGSKPSCSVMQLISASVSSIFWAMASISQQHTHSTAVGKTIQCPHLHLHEVRTLPMTPFTWGSELRVLSILDKSYHSVFSSRSAYRDSSSEDALDSGSEPFSCSGSYKYGTTLRCESSSPSLPSSVPTSEVLPSPSKGEDEQWRLR